MLARAGCIVSTVCTTSPWAMLLVMFSLDACWQVLYCEQIHLHKLRQTAQRAVPLAPSYFVCFEELNP
jgi:hypothetical protein